MTDRSDRRDLAGLAEARHHPAEIVFAVASFVAAVFLASRIGNQTTWLPGRGFLEQPAFWPIVSIGGMVLFGAFELWSTWRRSRVLGGAGVAAEVLDWARTLEFLAWFMAYVAVVPIVGYLPTTVAFCASLTFRLGYRAPRVILAAVATGIVTVVVFKAFLSVRIPGGALYEHLPAGLRNLMILYL
jgi:hypothetical protein